MSRENRSAVYQIDFTAVDAGKRIASSKRRIRWRFGFTNLDAMASGETGTACRGEEHDITLVWSLTSGKRLLLADGQEVHYSNSRAQVFDFSWTMRGNHALKVVAHAALPMNSHPNFRQYDLFVDGMSFFSMPKVYRLGLTDSAPVHEPTSLDLAVSTRTGTYGNYNVGRGGGYDAATAPPKPSSIVEIEAPHNQQEEEAYLREAIKASLNEQHEGAKTNEISSSASYNNPNHYNNTDEGDLLIDFMSEPGPAPAPRPTPHSNAMVPAPGASNPYSSFTSSFNAMPAQVQSNPIVDPFAPVPSSANPRFAAAGSSSVVSSLGASAALAAPPTNAPPIPAPVVETPFDTMPTQMAPPPVAPMAPPAPMVAPIFAPAAFAPAPSHSAPMAPAPAPAPVVSESNKMTMAPQSTSLGSDANAAYAKFANMDQFDLVKPTTPASAPSAAVNPFDEPGPTKPTPTLAGMKAMNQGNGEKKEVMKSALVPAQNQNGNWGGYGYAASSQTAQQPVSMGIPMGTMGQQQQQYGMAAPTPTPTPTMNGGQPQYVYPQQQQQQPQFGMQQGQLFQQQGYGQHSQPQQQQRF